MSPTASLSADNPLTGVGISMPLSDIVLLVFYIVLLGYIIYSVILYYHWQQYSTNAAVTWTTLVIYAVTTLPLILLMSVLALTL